MAPKLHFCWYLVIWWPWPDLWTSNFQKCLIQPQLVFSIDKSWHLVHRNGSKTVIFPIFGHVMTLTLIFDLWIPKSNQFFVWLLFDLWTLTFSEILTLPQLVFLMYKSSYLADLNGVIVPKLNFCPHGHVVTLTCESQNLSSLFYNCIPFHQIERSPFIHSVDTESSVTYNNFELALDARGREAPLYGVMWLEDQHQVFADRTGCCGSDVDGHLAPILIWAGLQGRLHWVHLNHMGVPVHNVCRVSAHSQDQSDHETI